MSYPPYTITSAILRRVLDICEKLGTFAAGHASLSPRLRRENRIRSIHASLAIENNSLSLEQVTDIINGRRVVGPARDIQEVRCALAAYEKLDTWQAHRLEDLLSAHAILMQGLTERPGSLRGGGVGIFQGNRVVHMAPPAYLVHSHLQKLLNWLENTDEHPLIKGCVFHYEFEFIHPFIDGNGRMGRLWHTLILKNWKPIFAWLPVETIVHKRQQEYYDSLARADSMGEATVFVEFMLEALDNTLSELHSDQVDDQASDQVGDHVRPMLTVLLQGEKSAAELMAALGLRHLPSFRKNWLTPALEYGLVERTRPDSPRSPLQKYRLTPKGKKFALP